MTPRSQIEALNLSVPVDEIKRQLTTCYHNKLPVYEGEINQIVGILHVRKAVGLLNQEEELTVEHFRELLDAALLHSGRTPMCSRNCSISRKTTSGWASSSTSTAKCRDWSRWKTSSRK